MFVKICGLANAEDVRAVAALAPDAIGFVFYPKSPRAVTPEQVKAWISGLPSSLLKVGVFVNETARRVNEIVRAAGLDIAQLHGSESAALCEEVDAVTWKAINFRDHADPAQLKGYRVDAFLIDSASGTMPGGTGQAVDWDKAGSYAERLGAPVVLAGGLNAGNVAEAIKRATPWGVDVSSGVELAPGRKDLEAVGKFIANARSA